MKKGIKLIIVSLATIGLALSCSTKKDSFINRTSHSMSTKYNVLFNGNIAFDEAKAELDRSRTTQDPTSRSFGRLQTTTAATTTISPVMLKLPITTTYAPCRTISKITDPQRGMPVLLACILASLPGCGTRRNTTNWVGKSEVPMQRTDRMSRDGYAAG